MGLTGQMQDSVQLPVVTDSPPRTLRWGSAGLFIFWFALISLFGAWAIAQHALPLPAAQPADQAGGPGLLAWYVLGADCGCSATVADDLVRRGPQSGWREKVWLVGDAPALGPRLRAAGFDVAVIAPEELARTHRIQGAPWLALFGPDGHPAYSGGYAQVRPGSAGFVDSSAVLMAAVARGEHPTALPAYGCATSDALRARLDPLGLRFSRQP